MITYRVVTSVAGTVVGVFPPWNEPPINRTAADARMMQLVAAREGRVTLDDGAPVGTARVYEDEDARRVAGMQPASLWTAPPTRHARDQFLRLAPLTRTGIAARAYDIHLATRRPPEQCWGAAMGEHRMKQQRGDRW